MDAIWWAIYSAIGLDTYWKVVINMMEFDIFVEILRAAERLDYLIKGLEKALDIQFGDGALIDTQTGLLDLLVDNCEYDTSEDSIIYTYCFADSWGSQSRIYYINDKAYLVNNVETLYKYLAEKFEYKSLKEAENE